MAGLILAAIGWPIFLVGLRGFTDGEIASVSMDKHSALRVYSYATAVMLIGLGALAFGVALTATAFLPRRFVRFVPPVVIIAYVFWVVALSPSF
ncbi:MAG: hypothetical protein DCC63_18780 [Nitrospira sp.]|nr:MAG: hypothetical protein DCC63_18780 [Nitrospira sp.]